MSKRWTIADVERLGLKIGEKGKTASSENLHPEPISSNVEAKKVKLPQHAYQALGRLPGRTMNNTEKRYADRLELRKAAGDVLWWGFELINLRLGDNCFYETDFFVLTASFALEVHEVKGFWTDDALVKIRVAAALFPFRFVAIQSKKGEWIEREF